MNAVYKIKQVTGLIHHSDRGSQFTDTQYRDRLTQLGIHISMGLIAQDNAYAERINGTIKNEYLNYKMISSFTEFEKRSS